MIDPELFSGHDLRATADWEPVQCVWLTWPTNPQTWPGQDDRGPRFERIAGVYRDLIGRITRHVGVGLLVNADFADQATRLTADLPGAEQLNIPTNDVWIRDYGPTFVASRTSGQLQAVVDWRYNAWGGKYPPWDDDDRVASQIADQLQIEVRTSGLCVEGGALEFDGDRRVLTTPACLITDTRNPGWTRKQVEQEIARQTGATEVVWVEGGSLAGDDTDGHIDQIARFIDPTTLVVAVADASDANHDGLKQNFDQLTAWGRATKPEVSVYRLPIPAPRMIDGCRVPESYCNYLRLGPDVILMPSFGDERADQTAAEILASVSGAQIEMVDCQDLVWGLGALHCCSREQPMLVAFDQ